MRENQLEDNFDLNEDLYQSYCDNFNLNAYGETSHSSRSNWESFFLNLGQQKHDVRCPQGTNSQQAKSYDSKICSSNKQKEIEFALQMVMLEQKEVQGAIRRDRQRAEANQEQQIFWRMHQFMDRCIFDFIDRQKKQRNQGVTKTNRFHYLSRDPQKNNSRNYTMKESYRRSNFIWGLERIYLSEFFKQTQNKQKKIKQSQIIEMLEQFQENLKNDYSQMVPFIRTDKQLKIYLPVEQNISIDEAFREYYLYPGKSPNKKQPEEQQIQIIMEDS